MARASAHYRPSALIALLITLHSALASTTTLAAEATPPPAIPLSRQGEALAQINHALIALSAGDTAPLQALPGSAFSSPPALDDEHDPDLARRWTLALPAAIARLSGTMRTRALASLDALYQANLPSAADPTARARVAIDFLPAPTAVNALGAAANLAFDRGNLEDFLAIARVLDRAGQSPIMADRREQIATLLSGRGAEIDSGLRLPPPGTPRLTAARPHPDIPRLAMTWSIVPGWIMACDPWGQVLWQYRVDRAASVSPGAGMALVRDSHGLRAIDDDGVVRALGPLPGGAQVLCIAGGAAWFATGARGWRLDLATGQVLPLDLGEAPLAAPLVRGPASLWLTREDLVLYEREQLVQRFHHGLPADEGWSLGAERNQPLILAADGRAFRLESLAEQLLHADAIEQARLLIQASRWPEAIAALTGKPESETDAGRALLLRAHLGSGPPHVVGHLDQILALARTPQQEITVRQCAEAGMADANPAARAAMQAALLALAHEHPAALFAPATQETIDFTRDPSSWQHVLSGAGHLAAQRADSATLYRLPGLSWSSVDTHPLPAPPDAGKSDEQRLSDGSALYRQRCFHLTSTIGRKELRCEDAHGHALWWRRWNALPIMQAPSSQMAFRDDTILVIEGQSRVNAFSISSGDLIARRELPEDAASFSQMTVLGGGGFAVLGPIGINHQLTVADDAGLHVFTLTATARWILPLGDAVVVAFDDGRLLRYPQGDALDLPPLRTTRIAPLLHRDGLVIADRLYPWRAP